jgi:acetyl esterase/lipase
MSFTLNDELIVAIAALITPVVHELPEIHGRDDYIGLRTFSDVSVRAIDSSLPEHPEVIRRDFPVPSYDGASITVRWYQPPERDRLSAAVYLHGGGMIAGSIDLYDRLVAGYAAESGVGVLSVNYRLAPEHPHPTPVEDCFAALSWLTSTSSGELGVDPSRIAIMGDSAGGGLAVAVAILARERELDVCRQILIYPMLDDRTTTPDLELVPFAGWTYENNYTGWRALLGDRIATDDVPAAAAPARVADFRGLPNAYVEVGELDIFRDESIEYARRLGEAGISSELHIHPGCPHGFDRAGRSVDVVNRAWADRIRVLRSL